MLRKSGRCLFIPLILWSISAAALAQLDQPPAVPETTAPETTTPQSAAPDQATPQSIPDIFDPSATSPDSNASGLAASGSAALAASGLKTAPPPTVIDGLGKGSVELTGPWQFHTGDDPAWASPDFDDSQWEQLKADNTWGNLGHAGYTGVAWYRLHLKLTPAPGADPDFALILHEVQDAYELYWNGVLIGHNGKLPPHPVWYFNRRAQTFGLGPIRDGVLAIRIWKAPLSFDESGNGGGFLNAPLIGGPEAIAEIKVSTDYWFLRSSMVNFSIHLLYGLVAFLSLIAWLRDRKQWHLFWIFVYCLFPLADVVRYDMRLPSSHSDWLSVLPIDNVPEVALWFLLLWLLELNEVRGLVRFTRIIAVIDLTVSLLGGLVDGPFWVFLWDSGLGRGAQVALAAVSWTSTLADTLTLVLVLRALVRRRKLDHARWLVAIFASIQELHSLTTFVTSEALNLTNANWPWYEKLNSELFRFNGNPIFATTLTSALLLFSIIYAVYRHSEVNRQHQAHLESEFKSARELQQVLIPETLPTVHGYALTSAYRPAQEVGGDFFQIIPLTGDSTLIVIGDVSGKGLRAAMTVSLIVGAIHALANEGTLPARFLLQLNRRLHGRLQGGFATCIALRVSAGGSCIIASAGHPGPFLNSQEMTLPGSLPLGLTLAAAYEDTTFRLQVNDRLSLFTDGLLEAKSPSGELYGFARLEALFAVAPTATQASEAAVAFGQDDDITILTLTRLLTGQESTAVYSTLKTLTRPILKEALTARIKLPSPEV
jgi:hypothetical protein